MEAITLTYKWDDWPEQSQKVFKGFRSEAGEEMILQKNLFVEKVLPRSIMRDLSEKEMEVYRKPFKEAGEDRRPTLSRLEISPLRESRLMSIRLWNNIVMD